VLVMDPVLGNLLLSWSMVLAGGFQHNNGFIFSTCLTFLFLHIWEIPNHHNLRSEDCLWGGSRRFERPDWLPRTSTETPHRRSGARPAGCKIWSDNCAVDVLFVWSIRTVGILWNSWCLF
jgi:hypothetical protein